MKPKLRCCGGGDLHEDDDASISTTPTEDMKARESEASNSSKKDRSVGKLVKVFEKKEQERVSRNISHVLEGEGLDNGAEEEDDGIEVLKTIV